MRPLWTFHDHPEWSINDYYYGDVSAVSIPYLSFMADCTSLDDVFYEAIFIEMNDPSDHSLINDIGRSLNFKGLSVTKKYD